MVSLLAYPMPGMSITN